jgi:hypothetical protein
MPRKKLTKAQGDKLLEVTKQRLRLEQEARTKARLEDLEIEVLENLGRQLRLEYLELDGELECPETDTLGLPSAAKGANHIYIFTGDN